MRGTSIAHLNHNVAFAQARSRSGSLACVPFRAAALLSILFFTLSCRAAPSTAPAGSANAPCAAITQGTPPVTSPAAQTPHPPGKENWTVAKDLPAHQVMRIAFSASEPTRGYASIFTGKQTQALYATTDSGVSWSQAGTVEAPEGDIISVDPLDPQDVVMLTVYAPMPGAYTFQRTLDGGRTWSPQTADLPVTGEISVTGFTGWSGSTFLVGFQLDGALQGSSAVIAFPKGGASSHLDDNGKINGKAIKHLHLLTGCQGRIKVWGDDGSPGQNIIGAATSDLGRTWTSLSPPVIGGASLIPAGAADDGSALVATSADNTQYALSSDGGNTWTPQPALSGRCVGQQQIFVTAKSETIVVACNDSAYSLRGGVWSNLTSNPVVCVSENGAKSALRLWSYDYEGRTLWRDE
jgi:photosystem II stability/assembly factor-like uncharacterized protein